MDEQYLMGNNDGLIRTDADTRQATTVSSRLRHNLVGAAINRAFEFYAAFFASPVPASDPDQLVAAYEQAYAHALSLGLFQSGGVGAKDHLNLWCLGRVFEPEVYIESGVYLGSSLHAFIKSPKLREVIAIDPDLSTLRIPKADIPGAVYIEDKDFSQLTIDGSVATMFAYFDDHINSADRILQAAQKGLTFILFDDSTGLEGICQRLYPAVPTIPVIMNSGLFSPGDELSWTFPKPVPDSARNSLKRGFLQDRSHSETRLSLKVTDEFIEKCRRAKQKIKKYSRIPDLGEFIPQMYPEKMVDTSKFLLELECQ